MRIENKAKLMLILGAILLISGCTTTDIKEAHLDYHNQEKWVFESGKTQSPIDIHTNSVRKSNLVTRLHLNPSNKVRYVIDNGHSIEVGGKGNMLINNRSFGFQQVHFHMQSEHTIDNKHYPLEAHFVSIAENGRIAVVGVLLEEGVENKPFNVILDNIGSKSPDQINLRGLLPKNYSYYHYLGSLTTPPLTENVEWYLLKDPVTISKAQIERFEKYYDFNNRKTQPLNNRKILTNQ